MKKKRTTGYLAGSLDTFLKSWRISLKKLTYVVFLDAAFLIISFASFGLLLKLLEKKASTLADFDPQLILDTQNAVMADAASKAIDSVVASFKAYAALWVVLLALLFSVSAYLIWFAISGRRKGWISFFKLLPFSIFFFIGFLLKSVSLGKRISDGLSPASDIAFLAIFALLSTIFYSAYARSDRLIRAAKDFFRALFSIHRLLLPVFVTALVILASASSLSLISNWAYGAFLFAAIMLAILAWARNYIHLSLSEITR